MKMYYCGTIAVVYTFDTLYENGLRRSTLQAIQSINQPTIGNESIMSTRTTRQHIRIFPYICINRRFHSLSILDGGRDSSDIGSEMTRTILLRYLLRECIQQASILPCPFFELHDPSTVAIPCYELSLRTLAFYVIDSDFAILALLALSGVMLLDRHKRTWHQTFRPQDLFSRRTAKRFQA